LAAACRKVSRRAAVLLRKANVFRKIRTKGNCGPQKELAAADRKMTRCAKVAQRKGHGLQGRSHEGPSVEQERRKNQTRNKIARGTRKGRTDARNETTDAPGRYQWNREPRLRVAATYWKREDNQRDLQKIIRLD
jgi:hypothetical protein